MKQREEEEYNQNKGQIEKKIQERWEFLAEKKKQLRKKFKMHVQTWEKLAHAEADYYQRK